MVLYFSGTGNSRYAAKLIAEICGDELVSMNDIMRARASGDADARRVFHSEKPFVFACPVYSWNLPIVVKDFIRESSFEGCNEAYFYISCGHSTGPCTEDAHRLCDEKGLIFKGLSSVRMPENFITLFDSSSYETSQETLERAVVQIKSDAHQMLRGETISDPNAEEAPKSFSDKFVKLFYRRYVNDSRFSVNADSCIHCTKCEKICPLANIKLTDGLPAWHGNCTQCMGCISICPANAINCGKASESRRRYYLYEDGTQKR